MKNMNISIKLHSVRADI